MAEDDKTKKRNELKTKKRGYSGYDDEEFTEGQAGVRRSILSKYDEELEGTQETVRQCCILFRKLLTQKPFKGFRLGNSSTAPRTSKTVQEEQQKEAAAVNKSLLSIDYASKHNCLNNSRLDLI